MKVERIAPILTVDDIDAAVAEHSSVLGMRVVMNMGWIVFLADHDGRQIGLMTTDATAPVNPDVSVFVDDVEAAHAAAVTSGLEIIHPLSTEPWGVRRFFYRDASGRVVNVGTHV
ncbi:VOC family protein [Tomitella cavernea]|uniref:VOC family protein n=1 Tax=Tomitella cavernea TaxID=1387982 RepID=A0ABP9CJU6_9ACTN|nr:VOC family protein [Tomitella cavernea]